MTTQPTPYINADGTMTALAAQELTAALVIGHAEANAHLATMRSSAELSLAYAKELAAAGDLESAARRAIHSLRYSLGILHPTHQKAVAAFRSSFGSEAFL